MDYREFKNIINQTQIIKMPTKNIVTFDQTLYKYYFLSAASKTSTYVREGSLKVKKPLIFLPEDFHHSLKGFKQDVNRFANRILAENGSSLKSLGYRFEHIPHQKSLQKHSIEQVIMDISKVSNKNPEGVIVVGRDSLWQISLLRFIFKIIERSFLINFEEIEERGFFDKKGIPPSIYKEIDGLFALAKKDKKRLKQLGALLLENDLFEDYEEQFFNLIK